MLVKLSDKPIQARLARSFVVRLVPQSANAILSDCRLWTVEVSLGRHGQS